MGRASAPPLSREAPASEPARSRSENAVSARQVAEINRLVVRQFLQRMGRKKPKRLILDVDPADDPCHGGQPRRLKDYSVPTVALACAAGDGVPARRWNVMAQQGGRLHCN